MSGNNKIDPKAVTDLANHWKEAIVAVAALIVPVIGHLVPSWNSQVVAYAVSGAIILGLVSFKVYKSKVRLAGDVVNPTNPPIHSLATFRDLQPFGGADSLPGTHRRTEARGIANLLLDPSFRFGILCGESGCGKTSLIRSEVNRLLIENRVGMLYLPSPCNLYPDNNIAMAPAATLQSLLQSFADLKVSSDIGVVVIDQFEEWFATCRERQSREVFGAFLHKVMSSAPFAKILCVIRREYLVEFHDFRNSIQNPTSVENTRHLRNFTREQAVNVILECADADGIPVTERLAEEIAADLADGDEVRPPELQLVCSRLARANQLNEKGYETSGGASKILAEHIIDSIAACKDNSLASRVLRSLCHFPGNRKEQPQTIREVFEAMGTMSDAQYAREEDVAEVLEHFVLARVVAKDDGTRQTTRYYLVHDYLVPAVRLATSDTSTLVDEANNLLRYYDSERKTLIPARDLKLIRNHANSADLNKPKIRRLIRRSRIAPFATIFILVVVAGFFSALFYLLSTARVDWQRIKLARIEEDGKGIHTSPIVSRKDKTVLQVSPGFHKRRNASVWGYLSGEMLTSSTVSDAYLWFGPDAQALWWESGAAHDQVDLVLPADMTTRSFSNSFSPALTPNLDIHYWQKASGIKALFSPGSWYLVAESITDKRTLARVGPIRYPPDWRPKKPPHFTADHKMVIVAHEVPGTPPKKTARNESGGILAVLDGLGPSPTRITSFDILDCATGRRVAHVHPEHPDILDYDVDAKRGLLVVLARAPTGELQVDLWRCRDGLVIGSASVENFHSLSVHFGKSGGRVLLPSVQFPGGPDEGIMVFRTSNMECEFESHKVSVFEALIEEELEHDAFWWVSNGSLSVWSSMQKATAEVILTRSADVETVRVDNSGTKALVGWRNRYAELWDLKSGSMIRSFSDVNSSDTRFTIDNLAVVAQEEEGIGSIYSADDGTLLFGRISVSSRGSTVVCNYENGWVHVWSSNGQVDRYVRGRYVFGRFVPVDMRSRIRWRDLF